MTDLRICAFCRTRIPKSIIDQHLLIVHGYSDPQPGREWKCVDPKCHCDKEHKSMTWAEPHAEAGKTLEEQIRDIWHGCAEEEGVRRLAALARSTPPPRE